MTPEQKVIRQLVGLTYGTLVALVNDESPQTVREMLIATGKLGIQALDESFPPTRTLLDRLLDEGVQALQELFDNQENQP